MSRYIVMSLILIIGLGIGSIVPSVTSWWYDINHASSSLNFINAETALMNNAPAMVSYHFGLEQGGLSVIEGPPGSSGKEILAGLNIQAWSKELLDIAPKIEFYSLDEVQSFIDSVNEPLWGE